MQEVVNSWSWMAETWHVSPFLFMFEIFCNQVLFLMNMLEGVPQDVTGHRNLGELPSAYLSYVVDN